MPEITASEAPGEVVAFWRNAGPKAWFAKSDAFDAELRRRYLHEMRGATLNLDQPRDVAILNELRSGLLEFESAKGDVARTDARKKISSALNKFMQR